MIVGLTGSIAMGKSTAAKMARGLGVPVFDSDATVRALTAPHGQALPAIAAAFPSVVENGVLDRKALAQLVFNTPQKLHRLESILHPMVKRARQKFLQTATRHRRKRVVFDIPLLFETKAERECDLVLVVCAPAFLQRQRILARPGMTAALFNSVLQRQMPAAQKMRRADIVISSGCGRGVTFRQLKKALALNRRT
jgi:dephospho-CoA kinase